MNNFRIVFGGPHNSHGDNPPMSHKNSSADQEKPWRILIVEDELLVAENIKELLMSEGYAIAGICSSGEETIESFEKMNPDLILMDIRLAGHLDGIQTAETIHRDLKNIPTVFLSAYGQEMLGEIDGLKVGSFEVLAKPYDKMQVSLSIARLLKRFPRPIH